MDNKLILAIEADFVILQFVLNHVWLSAYLYSVSYLSPSAFQSRVSVKTSGEADIKLFVHSEDYEIPACRRTKPRRRPPTPWLPSGRKCLISASQR